jgi:calcineurin-like phosphoesterase family protein
MTIQKYFFTSDQHLSHRNVIKYVNRPFKNVDEMNEAIIERWNNTVGPNDVVFNLGDVAFEKDEAKRDWMLSRMNGEKHLIWGNHDKGLKHGWQRNFKSVADMRVIHVPPEANAGYVGHRGGGQRIVLCHYAMRVWDQSHYGTWQLYGHSHGSLPDDKGMLSCDVGVDCWNFTPVSMEQLNQFMAKKTFRPLDHHGKTWNDDKDDV